MNPADDKLIELANRALEQSLSSRHQVAAWTMLANGVALFATISALWSSEYGPVPDFAPCIALGYLIGTSFGFISRFFSIEFNAALARAHLSGLKDDKTHVERRKILIYEHCSIFCWIISALIFFSTTVIVVIASPHTV